MRCRACQTICSATSRGRADGGNTNRASANAKAAPVTTHPCRAPCFADRPPQKRNPCPRAVVTRTRPSAPPPPFCCSNTTNTVLRWCAARFEEQNPPPSRCGSENDQGSRRRLACPSANSWALCRAGHRSGGQTQWNRPSPVPSLPGAWIGAARPRRRPKPRRRGGAGPQQATGVSRSRRARGPPDMGETGTAGGKPPAAS